MAGKLIYFHGNYGIGMYYNSGRGQNYIVSGNSYMIVWQKSKTRFVLIRTHQLDTSIATIIYILQLYLYQISTNFYIAVTATYIREIQPQIHNRDTDLIRIATSPFAPLTDLWSVGCLE